MSRSYLTGPVPSLRFSRALNKCSMQSSSAACANLSRTKAVPCVCVFSTLSFALEVINSPTGRERTQQAGGVAGADPRLENDAGLLREPAPLLLLTLTLASFESLPLPSSLR